jgi:hypothetical protein
MADMYSLAFGGAAGIMDEKSCRNLHSQLEGGNDDILYKNR